MLRCAIVVLAFASTLAHADSVVTVTLNQAGHDLADQIGLSLPDFITTTESRINELFELQGLPHLLHSFATTGAFANHGLGVDYQPDPNDLMFGVVADTAFANDAKLSADHVLSATVINYGLIANANLGRWNHPRWTVFANGSYATTVIHGLSGHLLSAGGHVQYKVLPSVTSGQVRWTGLDVTTGVEYARWEIGLSSHLDTNVSVKGSVDHATVDMASTGTLTVLAETTAVPIEVTTGVRLFNVIGLYAGGGFTLTTGSSTVSAQLSSLLTINTDNLPIGTAMINASAADGPSVATVHALAGLQVHTPHVRIYLQGLVAPDERSLALGLRGGLD
jgi:hypothetical protein